MSLKSVLNKITWRLLPFMFVLYIVSYLDRINVSYAGLQMNSALGFDDNVFGLGAGVFFLGYFLFGVPSNLVMERLGARKWIATIMIVWGAISAAMALVHTRQEFYVMRFFLGVAEAGFFPGMILYLTYWFPKREHGMAVARFMTAVPAAGLAGGLIAAQVLPMTALGIPGWKWLFIITGAPSVLLGIIVLFTLTNKPEDAAWLSDDEKRVLLEHVAAQRSAPAKSSTNPTSPVMAALTSGRVWLLALLYFCLTLGMYGFQLWLPQIVQGISHGNDSQTALLSSIPAIFQALGMVLIAGNSDRTGERRYHLAGSAILAAVGLTCAGLLQSPQLALLSLCFTAMGIWGTVGPFWALPTGYLSASVAATGIGLINSVGNLGGFAGPYFVGAIKAASHNFALSLLFMAGSLVFAAVLAVFLKIPRTEPGSAGGAAH
jgi:ACS family tartrate transporter-like MFS transporter